MACHLFITKILCAMVAAMVMGGCRAAPVITTPGVSSAEAPKQFLCGPNKDICTTGIHTCNNHRGICLECDKENGSTWNCFSEDNPPPHDCYTYCRKRLRTLHEERFRNKMEEKETEFNHTLETVLETNRWDKDELNHELEQEKETTEFWKRFTIGVSAVGLGLVLLLIYPLYRLLKNTKQEKLPEKLNVDHNYDEILPLTPNVDPSARDEVNQDPAPQPGNAGHYVTPQQPERDANGTNTTSEDSSRPVLPTGKKDIQNVELPNTLS